LFFDIGANIGTHSLYAHGTGLFSRVVSVEPEADNYDQLCRNLRINGFDSSFAMRAAFSSRPGEGLLAVSAENLGDHTVVRANGSAGDRPTEKIEFVDFDSVCARLAIDPQSPLMFWVDTQGHEFEVLSGIPEARLRRMPFVIEYWPPTLRRNGTLESLHTLLGRVADRFIVLQDGRPLSGVREVAELGDALLKQAPDTAYVDLLCFGSDLDSTPTRSL
jgi:FkbM family methyltransferase